MNLISMDKKYRRRGGTEPIRVLCVDRTGDTPVIYLHENSTDLIYVSPDGRYVHKEGSYLDLVEYIETKMVPLRPIDVPIGSAIRHKNAEEGRWSLVVAFDAEGVVTGTCTSIHFYELKARYNINRNDGKGWVACEKPAQE